MKSKLLVIIESAPAPRSKASEGLRVAAGLAAWGQFDVTVCLKGAAWADESDPQAGPFAADHLELLRQSKARILHLNSAGKAVSKRSISAATGFESIPMKAFATLAMESQHTLVF